MSTAEATNPTWTFTLVAVTPQAAAQPLFTEIADLQASQATVTDELVGPGTCEVETSVRSLEDNVKTRLQDTLRGPCEIWAYRSGVHVFGGPVVARSINNSALQITAWGLASYLMVMALDVDWEVVGRDQTTIVRDLVDLYQAQEYGHFGVDTTDLTPTGVQRDLTLRVLQATYFDRIISEMGGRDQGFDLVVDPATRRIRTIHPYRGRDLSSGANAVIIDGRSIVRSSWSATNLPGQVATDVITTSSAPTGGGVIGRAADVALRAQAGRRTVIQAYFDIIRQETIDAKATQLVVDLGTQVVSLSSSLVPLPDSMAYGAVEAGDSVMFDHDFGLGPTLSQRRIRRLVAEVSAGTERLAVEFV